MTGRRRDATLADVAREAGVSLATASRAFSGSPGRQVRADLRQRVLEAAARLDFSPNPHAQAVSSGRSRTLGLIVHDIADPYFSTIAAGISEVADEASLVVTLATTGGDGEREVDLVRQMGQQRARALILAGGRTEGSALNRALLEALEAFRGRGGAVALIGQPLADIDTVVVANQTSAEALARALADRGYRRFGILAGPPDQLTAQARVIGFRAGLERSGRGHGITALVPGALSRDGGYLAMTEMLTGSAEIDVVFAVSDVMAVGALSAARDLGVGVPSHVAVAGFDDIAMLRDVTPSLTTVSLPLEELGRAAARLVLDPGDSLEPRRVVVQGQVVLRESTPGPHRLLPD